MDEPATSAGPTSDSLSPPDVWYRMTFRGRSMPPSVQRGRLKFGESCCALTSQRLSLHLGPRARYAFCPSRLWASASTAALGFTAAASVWPQPWPQRLYAGLLLHRWALAFIRAVKEVGNLSAQFNRCIVARVIGKQDRAAVHQQGFADAVQANIFCVEPVPHPCRFRSGINSNCSGGHV